MISARRMTPWVAIALMVGGVVCIALRLYSRELHLLQGDSVWRLTYDLNFTAPKSGVTLRVAVPRDSVHSRVFRQELRYTGLNTERLRPTRSDTREFSVSTQRSGDFHLAARFDVHLSPRRKFPTAPSNVELTPEERAHYLRSTKFTQVDNPLVDRTLERLQGNVTSRTELIGRLFQYCQNELTPAHTDGATDALGTLERGKATELGRARALVARARAAKIPARLVTGFEIRAETLEAKPRIWVEALTVNRWDAYDPESGYYPSSEASSALPHNFLAVRHDGIDIIHTADAIFSRPASYSLVRLPPPAEILRRSGHGLIDILDLTRLRLDMHEVLSLMLLIPIGALVTAVFRTLIGIRTFGTFTPTLLALAFVYSDWRTGLVVFVVVVGLGLMARNLIDRLKLLMVPRLSAILTLVVVCIVFSVSILDYFRLTPSAQAVLLPMVILTSTIERFFVTTEEDGVKYALQLLASTVVLAFLCYLVLRWESVGRLLLTYPEIHCFTVALLLLIGRYTGYRLTELWRFRDFSHPQG